jgi:hypothetical protein
MQADGQKYRGGHEKHHRRDQERSYKYPNHDTSPLDTAEVVDFHVPYTATPVPILAAAVSL